MKGLALAVTVVGVGLLLAFGAFPVQAAPKRMVIEETLTIKGEVLRPNIQITMQRSKINYDALQPDKSFLDRIVRSVRHKPF